MSWHLFKYGIMSGCGFGADGKCGLSSAFWMAWIGIGILVILLVLSKKWLGEEEIIGYPFNWLGSFIGILIYIIVVSITGSAKWSLLAGLIGLFGGGFGLGSVLGGSGE